MIKEVLLVQLKIIYKNTLFIVFSSLEKKTRRDFAVCVIQE